MGDDDYARDAGQDPLTTGAYSRSCVFSASSRSNASLVSRPPPKPVRSPLMPMTRWQGTTIGIGLRPFAAPTARA